jgi:hypothetical protein
MVQMTLSFLFCLVKNNYNMLMNRAIYFHGESSEIVCLLSTF